MEQVWPRTRPTIHKWRSRKHGNESSHHGAAHLLVFQPAPKRRYIILGGGKTCVAISVQATSRIKTSARKHVLVEISSSLPPIREQGKVARTGLARAGNDKRIRLHLFCNVLHLVDKYESLVRDDPFEQLPSERARGFGKVLEDEGCPVVVVVVLF